VPLRTKLRFKVELAVKRYVTGALGGVDANMGIQSGILQHRHTDSASHQGMCLDLPSRPNSVYSCLRCGLTNELDVAIIVDTGAAWHFNELISHVYVLCVASDILLRCHCNEANGFFITEGGVCPATDAVNEFDRCDAIVCHQNRVYRSGALATLNKGINLLTEAGYTSGHACLADIPA
jgi:hypothetical protein